MKHHDLVDIDCLLRFFPRSGQSIAIAKNAEDLDNPPIFLPLSEIEWAGTGKYEGSSKVITITLPQWLAEAKGMV